MGFSNSKHCLVLVSVSYIIIRIFSSPINVLLDTSEVSKAFLFEIRFYNSYFPGIYFKDYEKIGMFETWKFTLQFFA